MNGINYWELMTTELESLIIQTSITNREKLASSLLGRYTSSSKGWHIGKGELGECWQEGCSEVRDKHNRQGRYVCYRCKIADSIITAVDKLAILEEHSLFKRHSVSLADLRKYI